MPASRLIRHALGTLLAAAVAACGGSGASGPHYDVTITRTAYGIPHIRAADYGSLGYGYGYAFAQDNLCTFMQDVVTLRGQRAYYFGGAGSYSIPAVPVTANNIDSDFFWRFMADDAAVRRFENETTVPVRELTTGYRDGINRYIAELKAGDHPGANAACAGAPWLQPLTSKDLYRRYIQLAILASSEAFIPQIATAQPPSALTAGTARSGAPADDPAGLESLLAEHPGPFAFFDGARHLGSNMYGLGPGATSDGSSILFGNPHFPWTGTERLYAAQLTVPGKMNVMGASLYGEPLILIGFNDHLAWSHTVSTAYHFTLYQLQLDPKDPTHYLYDGKSVAMTPVPIQIQVTQPDGQVTTATRTLYRSQYGPMLEMSVSGVPVLGWNRGTAYTLRDANYENTRLMNQFFAFDSADSLAQFEQAQRSIMGTPWVNTVATGPGEDAYYADLTVVPNVPDSLVQSCSAGLIAKVIDSQAPGLPVLKGNSSDCQWLTDADAPVPGIFGPSHMPVLVRHDWVANMNDSYWLTNPAQPLTGYARIIGDENTARSLRTRLGILQIQRRLAGTDGLPGTGFDLANLEKIVLDSHIYSAELALPDVLGKVCANPLPDIAAACTALAQWDGSATLDARGEPVWMEFWNRIAALKTDTWKTAFDPAHPVTTPNTLNTALPGVRKALADAQSALEAAAVPLSAPLAELQLSGVNGDIPIFGSEGKIGAFTVADTVDDGAQSALQPGGYRIVFGNSYIQAVTWNAAGVQADGFVTYSESTDPANPHYADFTRAYSQQQWHPFAFSRQAVEAAEQSSLHLTH